MGTEDRRRTPGYSKITISHPPISDCRFLEHFSLTVLQLTQNQEVSEMNLARISEVNTSLQFSKLFCSDKNGLSFSQNPRWKGRKLVTKTLI